MSTQAAADTGDAPRARLDAIQLLRALGASMVVLGHLKNTAIDAIYPRGGITDFHFAGGGGVDVFFVVSGFIIVHVARRQIGLPRAGMVFLTRRLARIVPLYWAVTLLALTLAFLGDGPVPGWRAIAASLAFVPYDTLGKGAFYPVLTLGWTLNYEVVFYLVFAFSLAVAPQRCVPIAVGLLLLAVTAAQVWVPRDDMLRFWSQPIVLEFVCGMLLAAAHVKGWLRLRPGLRGLAVAAAIGLYMVDPLGLFTLDVTPNGFVRVFGWGVPAGLLMLAAVSGPFPTGSLAARVGLAVGDASFALYLLHPFAIAFCQDVWPVPALSSAAGIWLFCAFGYTLAVTGSIAASRLVEQPLTNWLNGKLP